MKRPMCLACLGVLAAWLVAASAGARGAELSVSTPLDYQVVQHSTRAEGEIRVRGELLGADPAGVEVQARVVTPGEKEGAWSALAAGLRGRSFEGTMKAPAGGWYRLEVRARRGDEVLCRAAVEHVGIGEVFVVAGQSNSANFGETKQVTQTHRVSAFDGHRWQPADDPQPGAGGKGGSFLPPLGDALVRRLDVPVGFISCGIGATSVREWLPRGVPFPNPPTLESRVRKLGDGQWESNGSAFATLVARMKSQGPHGFRAVLWHQGESDANQKDSSRTLPGKLYRQYLERIIRDSRHEIGWDVPWFVAQASYHGPGDEGSPDIRAAQASLWKDGIALEGPDSDALKGELREHGGKGVHFSDKGLHEHAAKWAEKVGPWVERELGAPPPGGDDVRRGEGATNWSGSRSNRIDIYRFFLVSGARVR